MYHSIISNYIGLLAEDGFRLAEVGSQPSPSGGLSVNWWKIAYETPERRKMYIYMTIDKDYMFWEFPLLLTPVDETCAHAAGRYMLALNDLLPVVRFSVDGENRINMGISLLGSTLSFNAIKTIFHILRACYESYYAPLKMLTEQKNLAQIWLKQSQPVDDDLDIPIIIA